FTVDGISRSTELYYRTYRPLYYTGDQDYRVVQQGGNVKFGVPFSETDTVFFGIGYERTTIDVTTNTPLAYQNYVAKNGRITNNFPIT
ncbi:BamA/TamA family outer membrane protein, partial [Xanthomonas citri pv. citri]|nr:BamA/TamA family outer membrane protein [Xanthomonas citri pv. citri]